MKLKVADAVWVATAHLHQERPDADDFSIAEVIDRTVAEGLTAAKRISIQTHAYRHLVANREPRYATYRMLQETKPGRRRLHWLNDPYHAGRQGPPDQLGTQLACAAQAQSDLFITNDDRLTRTRVPGIQFITSLASAPI
jgi:hypothetical protein